MKANLCFGKFFIFGRIIGTSLLSDSPQSEVISVLSSAWSAVVVTAGAVPLPNSLKLSFALIEETKL